MYQEEIVMKINKLIYELMTDFQGCPDTHKIAIHGLRHTRDLLIKGMSYNYYLENEDLKPLEEVHY